MPPHLERDGHVPVSAPQFKESLIQIAVVRDAFHLNCVGSDVSVSEIVDHALLSLRKRTEENDRGKKVLTDSGIELSSKATSNLCNLLRALKRFCSDDNGNLIPSDADTRVWDLFKQVDVVDYAAAPFRFVLSAASRTDRFLSEKPFSTSETTLFQLLLFLWALKVISKRVGEYKDRRKLDRKNRRLPRVAKKPRYGRLRSHAQIMGHIVQSIVLGWDLFLCILGFSEYEERLQPYSVLDPENVEFVVLKARFDGYSSTTSKERFGNGELVAIPLDTS